MTNPTASNDALKDKVRKMAAEGNTISKISQELGISWNGVRSYTASWQGTKVKLTNRLKSAYHASARYGLSAGSQTCERG